MIEEHTQKSFLVLGIRLNVLESFYDQILYFQENKIDDSGHFDHHSFQNPMSLLVHPGAFQSLDGFQVKVGAPLCFYVPLSEKCSNFMLMLWKFIVLKQSEFMILLGLKMHC